MQREASQPDLFTPISIAPALPVAPSPELGKTAGLTGASDSAGIADPAPALIPARAIRENPPPMPREPLPPTASATFLLPRLSDGHLKFAPIASRFESIAAETLNNAGTAEDGFDDMHSAIVQSFSDDTPALPSLDQNLAAAEFVPGEFADVYHAPVISAVQSLLDDGDSAMGDVATSFGLPIDPGN